MMAESSSYALCTSRGSLRQHFRRLTKSYGLQDEFITPHCLQQNGMVERLIRSRKEQCIDRHRFESQQHAMRVIGD